jgi:hypothetical protein
MIGVTSLAKKVNALLNLTRHNAKISKGEE